MSISARATHVLSAMLIVVFACSGSAWVPLDRTTHCPAPMVDCHDVAVITCCAPAAPAPLVRPPVPEYATSPVHVSSTPLMDDIVPQAPPVTMADVSSPHWIRILDLPTLHRSFVI